MGPQGEIRYRASRHIEWENGYGRVYATDDARSGWITVQNDQWMAWSNTPEVGEEWGRHFFIGVVHTQSGLEPDEIPKVVRGRMYLTFTPRVHAERESEIRCVRLCLKSSYHMSPGFGTFVPMRNNDSALQISMIILPTPPILGIGWWMHDKVQIAQADLSEYDPFSDQPFLHDAPDGPSGQNAAKWCTPIPLPLWTLDEKVLTLELRHSREMEIPSEGEGHAVNFYRADWQSPIGLLSTAPYIEYQRA